MDILFFAQSIFYVAASIFIVVLGVVFIIIGYYTASIARHVYKISENLTKASAEVKKNVEGVIEKLYAMPIVSLFMRNRNITEKGRGKKKIYEEK